MTPSKQCEFWKLVSASGLAIACSIAYADVALAQIIPDRTLPNNSTVTESGNAIAIEGGTQAGNNLFHSFESFSLPTGNSAYFNNAADVANIFSRVTGRSASNIDGLIRANGRANLFLLNPNGIAFGANARLNIGGSFIASSADRINFADDFQFSATSPQTPPLLTLSVPVGLQMGQNPGAIAVQGNGYNLLGSDNFSPLIRGSDSTNLQVSPGQTLALVGGDVNIQSATLTAAQGRIELGSVADGQVSLNWVPEGLVLGYQNVQRWGDIRLSQQALADASDGSIQVQGNNVLLSDGSLLLIQNQARGGGRIDVNAASAVQLSSVSPSDMVQGGIRSENLGATSGADIAISSRQLTIQDGAFLGTSTFSSSRAGNVAINASDSMQIIGFSSTIPSIPSVSSGVGTTVIGSSNDAGDITVSTGRFTVLDGASLASVSFGTGKGGDVTVNASGSVELSGRSPVIGSSVSRLAANQGNGGKLTVNTSKLSVQDGASINSGTLGTGSGGNLTINASESVEVNGSSLGSPPSFIGSVATQTSEVLQQLLRLPPVPTGFSGDATINTPRLSVTNGAFVGVRHEGIGDAGTLRLNANSIFVDTEGAISAATLSGQGGNIDLQVRDLLALRRGGQITTSAGGTGNGGNIKINTPFLVTIPNENSDISANSDNARGGNVTIDATGIFGIGLRDRPTPLSDLTATGATSALSGNVQLNIEQVELNRGLVELPAQVVDTSGLIASGCRATRATTEGSSFIVTGRGGLPPTPQQELDDDPVWRDRRLMQAEGRRQAKVTAHQQPTTINQPLVEATGWAIASSGELMLMAAAPDGARQKVLRQPSNCNGR